MKVAVLGLGVEGISSVRHWQNAGHEVTVCDQNTELTLPDGTTGQLGPDYLKSLDNFNVIVRTAGMQPSKIVDANSPEILEKVTSATNEFYRLSPTKNIIGITGTKGKGTTSTLVYELLKKSGKTVHLGGNIGTSALDLLDQNIQPDDWVVLEQSSFQLCDQKYSPHIAVCLMVVPEHLDWHDTMEEYATAKQQIFRWQQHDDKAIFNRANQHSKDIVAISMAEKSSYEVPGPGAEPTEKTGAYVMKDIIYMNDAAVCHVQDVALLGRHNLQNVCAALATTWDLIDHDTELFKQVVSEFAGLPDRLQFVREVNGVRYYNDSLGTTPETAIAAIQAFDEPKVLILGGVSKGVQFDALAQTVAASNTRAVIAIGAMAGEITDALKTAGFENIIVGEKSMPEIIAQAASTAQPGDVVLLAPACASFDMFKDYKDRSQQFNAAVQHLPEAS